MLFKWIFQGLLYGFLLALEALLLVVICVAALVVTLVLKPEAVVNEPSARFVSNRILPFFDIQAQFTSFDAKFPRESFFERQIVLHIEDLSVEAPTFAMDWPELHFESALNLDPKNFAVKSIGPINLSQGEFYLELPPEDPKKEKEPFKWDKDLLKKIQAIEWRPIHVDFKELWVEELLPKKTKRRQPQPLKTLLKGSLALDLKHDQKSHWLVDLKSGRLEGTPISRTQLALDILLPLDTSMLYPIDLNLNGKVQLQAGGTVQAKGKGSIAALDDIRYKVDGSFKQGRQNVLASVSGFFDQGRFAMQLTGEAQKPIDALKTVKIDRCRFEGTYNLEGKDLLRSRNNCEIQVRRNLFPQEEAFADLTTDEILVKIDAPINLDARDKKTYLQADAVRVAIAPIGNNVYNLSLGAVGSFNGFLSESLATIQSEIKVNGLLDVPEFKAVEQRLRDTPYAIPAPLHTLAGPLRCVVRGSIKNIGEEVGIPLHCQSDLHSEVQSVVLDINGKIQTWLTRKPRIDMDVLLKAITLELPQLKVGEPLPQVLKDKRLHAGGLVETEKNVKVGEAEPLPVELAIRIKTPPDRPVLFITHITPTPVPIDLDLTINGDKLVVVGPIALNRYDVTFLKRKAFIDHLKISLDPTSESPPLDGLIRFDNPDYKIELKLSGSLSNPFYVFESTPPRSPTEILSMILFEGDPDVLADESLKSVEETRAAMVDGAIGLVSMYYLASTPIESVGYNPYTGVFRARVRLAQGLSMTLGSELGGASQSVSVRKRLTESWSFETTAETDEETNVTKGVALFKWGKRY